MSCCPAQRLPASWKASHPSLNPSSIWIRGIGSFMPCALKSAPQLFARNRLRARCGREFSRKSRRRFWARHRRSSARRCGPCSRAAAADRRQPRDIGGRSHRDGAVEGLQEAPQQALIPRARHIPGEILHEPSRAQEGDRHAEPPQRLLDETLLAERDWAGSPGRRWWRDAPPARAAPRRALSSPHR